MQWARMCVCVVNIVNPAVDWPLLLQTLTDRDLVRIHMSHDFDLHLTFDFDIGANAKFSRYTYFMHPENLRSSCFTCIPLSCTVYLFRMQC